MRLGPQERSLLAYFRTEDDARAASASLRAAGFASVQLTHVSRYGEATDPEGDNPAAGLAADLSSLTLYGRGDNLSAEVGENAGVLLAAHPSASGMAGTGGAPAGGYNYLVTVVTDEGRLREAEGIVRRCGGLT
ncbi:MAG: hypothetical protein QMC81_09455 [Thermoanaerobacterales bacterium]|nr:hypothetical protein [Bacillota bacterium]MDI6907688.1 hypothetical protein [Thermoanaerobacterales bacterium]